jgi:hypothetical protein
VCLDCGCSASCPPAAANLLYALRSGFAPPDLPPWWILVESATDRDVFFSLSSRSLPICSFLVSPDLSLFRAFIHVLEDLTITTTYDTTRLLLLVQVDPRLFKNVPQSRAYCSSTPLVKLAKAEVGYIDLPRDLAVVAKLD